jgi:hypothetical protein
VFGARLAALVLGDRAKRAMIAYAKSSSSHAVLDESEAALARELGAAFEAMYLMAASDGKVAPEELMLLSQSISGMVDEVAELTHAEAGLPILKLNEALARFARDLEAEGLERRLAAVAGALASPEARRLAFRLAAGVAFIDDFVANSEAAALDALGEQIGLAEEDRLALMREVHALLD